MKSPGHYAIPDSAVDNLNRVVDRIESRPGRFVDINELKARSADLDVRRVMETLPDHISESDFVGILRLAMLTECATDSYAAVFTQGAAEFNAPWLERFNQTIWVPDEHTHYTPYKYMLMSLGYSEEELVRNMEEVKAKEYYHCCGYTPVELTTYGVMQEHLTDNWHGIIAKLLRPTSPYASSAVTLVKRRETLHTMWYRKMTAIQVEGNPELLGLIVDTLGNFQMPGTRLVPDLGTRAMEWMTALNVDFKRVAQDIVRNFSEVAGSVRRSGEMVMLMAARNGYKVGPVPAGVAQRFMKTFGGHGLIGEAMLDKVGLPLPADRPTGLHGSVRSKVRTFIADHIDLGIVLGQSSPA